MNLLKKCYWKDKKNVEFKPFRAERLELSYTKVVFYWGKTNTCEAVCWVLTYWNSEIREARSGIWAEVFIDLH